MRVLHDGVNLQMALMGQSHGLIFRVSKTGGTAILQSEASSKRYFRKPGMTKSIIAYWNALSPESRDWWVPVKGLEGIADQIWGVLCWRYHFPTALSAVILPNALLQIWMHAS